MLTRAEHSKRIKQKRLIFRSLMILTFLVFIALVINSYLALQNNEIQIISKWHECKPNNCEYKLVIENTAKLQKSSFYSHQCILQKSAP